MTRLPSRLLVCSPELPPLYTGHAAVIERLFRRIDPADYCMVAFATRLQMPEYAHSPLPAKSHVLEATWRNIPPFDYPLRGARATRKFLAEAVRRARILAALARSEGCGGILVTSSNTPDPLAAALAARLLRMPLIVYMLDNWRHLMSVGDPVLGRLCSSFQPAVLAAAAAILAPNAALAADLARDHRRRAVVVGIPLPDESLLEDAPPRPWPNEPGPIRLVFTGEVYDAHFDALRRVLAALDSPHAPATELHVYSTQTAAAIGSRGITGKLVAHPHLPPPEIFEVQRSADILLLPLGFKSPYPDIVRTASPTKTGEYLASARPILVHAPPDSYPAQLCRRTGFGALVDTPSVDALVDALVRIRADESYRDALVRSAKELLPALHGPAVTTELFVSTVRRALAPDERHAA